MKNRNGSAGAVRKPVVGIQLGIAHEVIARAVQAVGAGAGDHVDDGAAGLAVFGGEEIRLHFELLHHVDGGGELEVRDAGVLFDGGNGGAVDQDVGGGVARAVGTEVGVVITTAAAGADDAGGEVGQAHRVPGEVRELEDVFVVDHLTKVGDGGVDEGRGALHLDGGGNIADLQLSIEGALFLDGDAKGTARILLKAGGFDDEGVVSGGQGRNDVTAGSVGDRAERGSAVAVGHQDFGAADGGTGFVRYEAVYAASERLAEKG